MTYVRQQSLPRVGVVVSSRGEGAETGVARLLDSLEAQTEPVSVVVVVDQSPGRVLRGVVREHESVLPIIYRRSGRGASVGRNVGLACIRDVDVVAFVDDDCWYGPEVVETVASLLVDGVDGVTGSLRSREQRLRFGDQSLVLDRRTVWTHAIEATTFLTRRALDLAGPFDELLGVGAASPWQSGEGTDLLLRAINAGAVVRYEPSVIVVEQPAGAAPDEAATRRKAHAYARGTGRVYRRYYGSGPCALVVLRPLLGAVLAVSRGDRESTRRLALVALGRAEGILGRLVGDVVGEQPAT